MTDRPTSPPVVPAQTEIGLFLSSRRARLTPADVGLPARRGAPGLRREEVAVLAGVSREYYARLERGQVPGVSGQVLDAVARVLRLTPDERRHLGRLARPGRPGAGSGTAAGPTAVRPELRTAVESISGVATTLRNARFDVLAANPLARALFAPVAAHAARTGARWPNVARFALSGPERMQLMPFWQDEARLTVAALRGMRSRFPHDVGLRSLLEEIASDDPHALDAWQDEPVSRWSTGSFVVRHPAVGVLELPFHVLEDLGQPGLSLIIHNVPAEHIPAILAHVEGPTARW